jgi:cytochrome b561
MVSAGWRQYHIDFFGLVQVPFLPVEQSNALGGAMPETHEILGFLALGLIVLHVATGFNRDLIDGDNMVERLLP